MPVINFWGKNSSTFVINACFCINVKTTGNFQLRFRKQLSKVTDEGKDGSERCRWRDRNE